MQRPKIRVGPAARRDLDRHTLWLAAEAGTDTALRFASSATDSFARLGSSPGIGSPVRSRNPTLPGLRKWRVDGFPKLLIFYLPLSDGIRVIRLLHAAQNWTAILDSG